jgi:hypothetical protein
VRQEAGKGMEPCELMCLTVSAIKKRCEESRGGYLLIYSGVFQKKQKVVERVDLEDLCWKHRETLHAPRHESLPEEVIDTKNKQHGRIEGLEEEALQREIHRGTGPAPGHGEETLVKAEEPVLGRGSPLDPLYHMKPVCGLYGFFNVGINTLLDLQKNSRVEGGCIVWKNSDTRGKTSSRIKVCRDHIPVRLLVYNMCVGSTKDMETNVTNACSQRGICIMPGHLAVVPEGYRRRNGKKGGPPPGEFIVYKNKKQKK